MNKPFYITTTLPYVNAEPHLGHAMEFVRADVITRYKKLQGYDVFFNTGMDEHGTKILEGAIKEGIDVQEYVDRNSARFKELYPKLGITNEINFIRTTEERHIKAAEEMWKRCNDNGYIYKKEYEAKYCVGCELYKTDSELVDDKCPIHPNREIEIIKEENYFFAFSKVESKLRELYEKNPTLVIPDFRFNEIKAFLDRGLEDFSISRLKTKMPWGVPVPGDDEHVMYVWFDALTSYISTLEWPEAGDFEKYWEQSGAEKREVIQYCGKDNLRQQSLIWQGMLLAAGLPTTTNIIIDGFIISGGQKMSKSIGNVINPFDILEMFKELTDYPEDVLRFILLHEVPSFEDGDLTVESIKIAYTAYLANGIGNLTSRIMRMLNTYNIDNIEIPANSWTNEFIATLESYDTNKGIKYVMHEVKSLDEYIQSTEPFKLIKTDKEKAEVILRECAVRLYGIGRMLNPFMPKTGAMIKSLVKENKMPEKPLFNRLP
ncbi:TPA: methionine--tRNA ligase [Candidatus Nomurabacteria bacterium]|nr:methionine--tRNA ligase [Candidatus Nomurabacteria bacterium]